MKLEQWEVWIEWDGRESAKVVAAVGPYTALKFAIESDDLEFHYGCGSTEYHVARYGSDEVHVWDVWTSVEPVDPHVRDDDMVFRPVVDKAVER